MTDNSLIQSLPDADRQRLLARCEPVDRVPSRILCEPGQLSRHVCFPTGGWLCRVARPEGSD